ncbi:hypothetical protein BV22DRAFT_1131904 [Leucogyrophana mollusca]|uniref:Uncharacterized protein n=1 Tax=Leucogyrophana mollusca TaxID=85980 RepID=A0ACB8B8U3_9AGAM|nr:hypothetical protein BV22DRAFT_1131904 [Leucogyrophana mollusca]
MAIKTMFRCPRPNCNQTFSRVSNLKKHEFSHNGSKALFACTFANCTFTSLQKKNLEIHFARHTGEKRHHCPESTCSFRTADPAALTRHRKAHHGYVPKGRSAGVRQSQYEIEAQARSPVVENHPAVAGPLRLCTIANDEDPHLSVPNPSNTILPKSSCAVTEPEPERGYKCGAGYDTYMNPVVFFPSPFSPLPTNVDPAHAIAGPTEFIGALADPDCIFADYTQEGRGGLCPEWLHRTTHAGITPEFVLNGW